LIFFINSFIPTPSLALILNIPSLPLISILLPLLFVLYFTRGGIDGERCGEAENQIEVISVLQRCNNSDLPL
jgi:hypothetical protein